MSSPTPEETNSTPSPKSLSAASAPRAAFEDCGAVDDDGDGVDVERLVFEEVPHFRLGGSVGGNVGDVVDGLHEREYAPRCLCVFGANGR